MRDISDAFDRGEYGYADYGHMKGYGISMTPMPWVYNAIAKHDVRIIALIERGWDNHQDVVAIQKRTVT